ncbi:MAG: serine/threonine-protein kinase, partial [Gemmataceae bacterium]
AGLNHPNIIRVHDFRREGNVLYLVMEFAEGTTLQAYVDQGGPVHPDAAAIYVRHVALGLQHAHESQLVHRDIKPANLMLTRDGAVKILDLGLVRSDAEGESNLTEKVDKAILGTADYLAPEQAVDSHNVDIRADLYSLGATFYYLLAGRPMFPEGRTAQKLMWQQLREPTPIQSIRPDVPELIAEILHKSIQKKPGDRFQSPEEFLAALAPWAEMTIDPPRAEWMPPPPPRWMTPRSANVPRLSGTYAGGSSQNSGNRSRSGNSSSMASRSSFELPPMSENPPGQDSQASEVGQPAALTGSSHLIKVPGVAEKFRAPHNPNSSPSHPTLTNIDDTVPQRRQYPSVPLAATPSPASRLSNSAILPVRPERASELAPTPPAGGLVISRTLLIVIAIGILVIGLLLGLIVMLLLQKK